MVDVIAFVGDGMATGQLVILFYFILDFLFYIFYVAIPSATLAIMSTNHPIKWLQHLIQWLPICHKST